MKEEGKKEETKKKNKKVKTSNVKMAVLSAGKRIIRIALMLILILIFLVGGCYVIKHNDAVFAESDETNAPYMVSKYTNSITIDKDGKITTGMTPQELWDDMIKKGNRVDEYLDSPEELAKLMNAQLITQYMDTRSAEEIDNEPIKWDDILENVDTNDVQGIIKMKRADSDGNVSTMTYVEPYMFYGWIEEYNTSGSEEAKQQLLTHFTLQQSSTTSSANGSSIVTSGKVADVSAAIVNEATKKNTYGLGSNVCQTWVGKVYEAAGFGYTPSGCCAYLAGQKWGISSDFSQIVNGAAVWTGSGSYRGTQCSTHKDGGCGHAGIYYKDENGNDWVLSLVGGNVKQDTLEHWLEYYGAGNTPVWGWQGGLNVEMEEDTTINSTESTSEITDTNSSSTSKLNGNGDSSNSVTSLNNFLFIGDSVLGTLKNNLEGEGATVLYRSSAKIGFFSQEDDSGNSDTNCKLTGDGKFDWDNNIGTLSKPTGICLVLGHNNVGFNNNSSITSMSKLVEKLQNQFGNNVPIYICSVLPCTTRRTDSYLSGQKELNEALKAYCSTADNVTYLDVLNGYIEESGNAKKEYVSDDGVDVHPSSSGVSIIFSNIKSKIIGGSASSTNSTSSNSVGSGPCALVATWEQVDYTETTDDPDAEKSSDSKYKMSTTPIYYQNLVSGYTMPFNYLWALLVITEDKDYVMELADLVYNSEIEFTVYDNLTVNTDIKTINYNRYRSVSTYASGNWVRSSDSNSGDDSDIADFVESPRYYHEYKTVTTTNTVNVVLSKADVWMLKYTQEYEPNNEPDSNSNPEPTSLEDINIAINLMNYDPSFVYGVGNLSEIKGKILDRNSADTLYWSRVKHTYTEKLINRTETIKNTTSSTGYISKPAVVEEKTDKNSDEPNFVTIFLKYREARYAILELDEWLFEILNDSKDTSDLIDLTKYMIYKAIGRDYGVTEFDFSTIWNKKYENYSSVSGGTSGLSDNPGLIYDFLLSRGVPSVGAAAVVGNIEQECGFDSSNISHYKGKTYNGFCQWDKPRTLR